MQAAAFTFEVPSSISMPPKTIPPVYIPLPKRSRDEQQSLPKEKSEPNDPPPSDDTEAHGSRTRFQRTPPSDDPDLRPLKMSKQILTSFSRRTTKEVEDYFSLRQFQLARASRSTVAAEADYRRLRVLEIEAMLEIAQAEVVEVEACLKQADIKLGQTRQVALSTGAYTEEDLDTLPTTRSPDEVYSDFGSSVGSESDDNSGCGTPIPGDDRPHIHDFC